MSSLPDVDSITFAIPGAGPHSITLAANLPVITQPLTIDGHPGGGRSGLGDGRGGVAGRDRRDRGHLRSRAHDGRQRGPRSRGPSGSGFFFADRLRVQGQRNRVEGNFVGADVNGVPQLGVGNNGDGVQVNGDDNVVGGTDLEDRNVIADNSDAGVRVDGGGSTGNLIQGNLIGTDATGTLNGGNGDGVVIAGDGNVVGGTDPGARNVIADNFHGIELNGDANRVEGNAIGTDITATVELDNFDGVAIAGDDDDVVAAVRRLLILASGRRLVSGHALQPARGLAHTPIDTTIGRVYTTGAGVGHQLGGGIARSA